MMNSLKYTANGEYIFSVQELNASAKQYLEQQFGSIWVQGELSNVSKPASGHYYFTLKDAGAQIKCAFFKLQQLKSQNLLSPEEGKSVLLKAKVSLYAERGEYQLIVEAIFDIGRGLLQQQFEFLKDKLAKAGKFSPEHKKPIPSWISRLGVITSQTGAALHDICAVLKRRAPMMELVIYHSAVQGEGAPAQLIAALQTAVRENRVEVILIARGGGSLEDLFSFNDESLIEKIFQCPLPTISAIGHEIDFTLCDFVADLRAPTPSAAAEIISQDQASLLLFLSQSDRHLKSIIHRRVSQDKNQILSLKNRLKHPQELFTQKRIKLNYLISLIHKNIHNLSLKKSRPYMEITHLFYSLSPEKLILKHRETLATLSAKIEALSPLKTLARGYAIVTHLPTQKILTQIQGVSPGDAIHIQLSQGSLTCLITDRFS